MDTLRQYWQALSMREQSLVLLGAVVVCLAILVLGIWLPMTGEKQRLTEQVAEKRETLTWMQQSVNRVKVVGSGSTAKDNRALPSRVSSVLQQQGLKNAKVSSKGSKQVSVQLESVPFVQLQSALFILEDRWRVEVGAVKFTAIKDKPGMVSATITLHREKS